MNIYIKHVEDSKVRSVLQMLGIDKITYIVEKDMMVVDLEKIASTNKESPVESESRVESTKENIAGERKVRKINFTKKKCAACGEYFIPTGPRSKHCDLCKVRDKRLVKNQTGVTKRLITKNDQSIPTKPSQFEVVSHSRKCTRCHKLLPISEFSGASMYCNKCVEKVQNAPKIKLSPDEVIIMDILKRPIADRYGLINKLTSNQKSILKDKLDPNHSDEEERSFAQEIINGLNNV